MKKCIIIIIVIINVIGCTENNIGDEEDTIPPIIINVQPSDSSTGVSPDTNIIITYSEEIMLGNAYFITVNETRAEVSTVGNQLFIDYKLEAFTQYIVNISSISVLDLAKNYGPEYNFSFSTTPEINTEIKTALSVQSPSKQAMALYNFLRNNYGNKSVSASMANVNWNINEANWVKQHTGKYPAMVTFDYLHLPNSPANWIDYSDISFIEDWWDNNGILSASWHWNVPKSEGSSNYSFKTENTSFKASNVIIEGTWENTFAKADLEKISGYLKLLQEKNIPVIWRPLHEGSGNIYEYEGGTAWFWWGASGATAYRDLWKFMFDYFESKGLNNLIWIWTTQTKDDDFYPGDEYVDIIGRDIYNNRDAVSIANEFLQIQLKYPNKMVTLSELGNCAEYSSQWEAGAAWSYFMPWYDFERTNNVNDNDFSSTNHKHANADWWINAMSQTYVISRDEMPDLK